MFKQTCREVISKISQDDATDIIIVKHLAKVLKNPAVSTEVVVDLNELLSDPASTENTNVRLIASQIYASLQNYEDALKVIELSKAKSLELQAFKIDILLRLNRTDLANEELNHMLKIEEDNTLTQLAGGWINLAKGGKSSQEAVYIFRELLERSLSDDDDKASDPSFLLMNALAVAQMKVNDFEGAMKVLQKGLKRAGVIVNAGNITWGSISSSIPGHLDLLANFVACCHHLNKLAILPKFLQKLEELFKVSQVKHPLQTKLDLLQHI